MIFKVKLLFSLNIVLIIIFFTSCSVPNRFSEFKYRKVHHFEMVSIGGIDQAILINGTNPGNPIMLYLHGGPGFPMLPFEPYDEYMKNLEDQFTIVYWEQRGTGKSFNRRITDESMSIEQFIADTHEVVEYIRKKLNVDKIYLWGHSWGSNLGAIYASRYPEHLYAYISTGQSVNPFLNERLAYEFVLQKASEKNNRRALRQLSRIDTIPANYTVADALTIRKWVYKYGGIVFNNENERPYVDVEEMRVILTSPLYPLSSKISLVRNPYFSINTLWKDLKRLNLFTAAPKIEVPVYFLVGRHDIIVSHVLAEQYFNHITAPAGKHLIWFEESAHRPHYEESEKFFSTMMNIFEATYNQTFTDVGR
jgi:pimeloyl-ACP methyl ester carboxylesterase